jgi:transposase
MIWHQIVLSSFQELLPVPSVRKGRHPSTQTDDGIHLETWNRLRTLLQHPRFIYVADCKLYTEKNLRMIDGERGFFVTVRTAMRRRSTSSKML